MAAATVCFTTMVAAPHQFVDTDAIRVVPPSEWDALVARMGSEDTYVRHGYHVASAHLEPVESLPVLLHFADAGGELALPLLLRPLPDGAGYDATSAYGYGGPVVFASPDIADFDAAYGAWAREHDVVSTFLRSHPMLANAAGMPTSAELIELGSTVAWDVAPGRDLAASMHTHHRRAARKADRAELEMRITVNPEDLSGFRAMYDHTMRRQDAADFYFFPDAYWTALVEDLDGIDLVLVEGLLEGEPVAAQLCFANGPWLHYHLGASADAARNIGASNRGFLAAAEWAQERGMAAFHLGGGVGGGTDSPLFVFKHRFDPESEPRAFHIAKLVHDPVRYLALAGSDSTAGYFPPWRAPETPNA
ncbi:MAG: putative GCN5-related N-acetyltransferase [Thermoleophilia bacterium]|nr:putative GCN5-related N-acetyltransferase [Thermoleophilia bacterium]